MQALKWASCARSAGGVGMWSGAAGARVRAGEPVEGAAGRPGRRDAAARNAALRTRRHLARAARYRGLFVLTPFRDRDCPPFAEGSWTPLVRRQVANVERAWLRWAVAAWAWADEVDDEALEAGALGPGELAVVTPARTAWAGDGVDGSREAEPQAARARHDATESRKARLSEGERLT